MKDIVDNAQRAEDFLKSLASRHRLMILCHLVDGEKNVSELMQLTGIPQTSMSQHLGKLKVEDIVTFRREHRTLYYSIAHSAVMDIMTILYQQFCKKD